MATKPRTSKSHAASSRWHDLFQAAAVAQVEAETTSGFHFM